MSYVIDSGIMNVVDVTFQMKTFICNVTLIIAQLFQSTDCFYILTLLAFSFSWSSSSTKSSVPLPAVTNKCISPIKGVQTYCLPLWREHMDHIRASQTGNQPRKGLHLTTNQQSAINEWLESPECEICPKSTIKRM